MQKAGRSRQGKRSGTIQLHGYGCTGLASMRITPDIVGIGGTPAIERYQRFILFMRLRWEFIRVTEDGHPLPRILILKGYPDTKIEVGNTYPGDNAGVGSRRRRICRNDTGVKYR